MSRTWKSQIADEVRSASMMKPKWPDDAMERVASLLSEVERLRTLLSEAEQREKDVAENELAYKEALQLAISLHSQHYSHIKQWKPLDDLRGIISQIDNMTCGMVSLSEAGRRQKKLRDALAAIVHDVDSTPDDLCGYAEDAEIIMAARAALQSEERL